MRVNVNKLLFKIGSPVHCHIIFFIFRRFDLESVPFCIDFGQNLNDFPVIFMETIVR